MRRLTVPLLVTFALAFVSGWPGVARAAGPVNDDYANATVISSLPFHAAADSTGATVQAGEPDECGLSATVWYAYTAPTNQVIEPSITSTTYQSFVVYQVTGAGLGGLQPLSCGSRPVSLLGGQSYAFQIIDTSGTGLGGSYDLSIVVVPPPANDDFANAQDLAPLPFSATVDTAAATLETNEPDNCVDIPPATGSVWYRIVPQNHSTVFSWTAGFETSAPVYTGTSLGSLTLVSCVFRPDLIVPGTTYYIQLRGEVASSGKIDIAASVLPPPTLGIRVDPQTPSTQDVVTFQPSVNDPRQDTFTFAWSFGDGATSSDYLGYHQYAHDGDYTVSLALTTQDGDVVTATTIVHVVTPPPPPLQAVIGFDPFDPSTVDTIRFKAGDVDPLGRGVRSAKWSFGDGTQASGINATHRYRTDGDYIVHLDIVTTDGRTASTDANLTVRTDDVRIIRFAAPAAAKVGQTRPIVVGLFDGGYSETVRVDVFRVGGPNGDPFGSQVLVLDGRAGARTAYLSFPYTFTKADASSKVVTFKVIVSLLDPGERDARPLDNQATAKTRVTPR